jgi:hypothetical protein
MGNCEEANAMSQGHKGIIFDRPLHVSATGAELSHGAHRGATAHEYAYSAMAW